MLLNGVRALADLFLGVLKSLKAARLALGLSMDPDRPRDEDDGAPEAGFGSLDLRFAEVGPLVEGFVLWARSPVFNVPIDLRFAFILIVQEF